MWSGSIELREIGDKWMWASREYLALCQTLHRAGFRPPIREGQRIARGFADVGFEEFWVLPQQKLVSIVNGQQSQLSAEHEKFFFRVPDVDALVDAITRSGYDLSAVQFVDQRRWHVEGVMVGAPGVLAGEGRLLPEALGKLLLAILDRTPKGGHARYG